MIGYKSPTHQGWKMASMSAHVVSPYPPGCVSDEEFMTGVRRFRNGEPWEGRRRVITRDDRR